MPIYIDQVEATVSVSDANVRDDIGVSPEQFRALLEAVIRTLQEKSRQEGTADEDAKISSRSRPRSLGD